MAEKLNEIEPLPARPGKGHKGTFGTVLVIGGCDDPARTMLGAPAFTALAAARTGCGMVRVAAPVSILPHILTIAPHATGLPLMKNGEDMFSSSAVAELLAPDLAQCRCVAVGPGWGVGFERQQLLVWVLGNEEMPVVLDADGINNLAQLDDFAADVRAPMVITPHPGEMQRLARALAVDCDCRTDQASADTAQAVAQRLGCVVVLKGSTTCITDGQAMHREGEPNPALAAGGTGDVLTGIIASLIAQYWRVEQSDALDLLALARWGVRIHAQAGAMWAQTRGSGGLVPGDLCQHIPMVLHNLRGDSGTGSK